MLQTKTEKISVRRATGGARAQQRVKDILRVGREVLAEKGYERATTTEIAQRLGISEATVFSYFASKRELCVRIISDWYDEIISVIEAGLPRDGGIRQQFMFLIRNHLRLFLQHGSGMCALVLSEGRAKHQDFGATVQQLQRRYTKPLMDVLALGQQLGQIRTDVPLRLLRSMVYGPMEHMLWDAMLAEHPFDIDRTSDQLGELLWQLLQTPAHELVALQQFQHDVAEALGKLGSD